MRRRRIAEERRRAAREAAEILARKEQADQEERDLAAARANHGISPAALAAAYQSAYDRGLRLHPFAPRSEESQNIRILLPSMRWPQELAAAGAIYERRARDQVHLAERMVEHQARLDERRERADPDSIATMGWATVLNALSFDDISSAVRRREARRDARQAGRRATFGHFALDRGADYERRLDEGEDNTESEFYHLYEDIEAFMDHLEPGRPSTIFGGVVMAMIQTFVENFDFTPTRDATLLSFRAHNTENSINTETIMRFVDALVVYSQYLAERGDNDQDNDYMDFMENQVRHTDLMRESLIRAPGEYETPPLDCPDPDCDNCRDARENPHYYQGIIEMRVLLTAAIEEGIATSVLEFSDSE